MPPLLAVSTLEGAACSSLSRLLVQAFAKLEAKKEESYEGSEEEKGVEEALDCLPAALLERVTHQALVLLTSQAGVRGTGPGWQFSRVRGGTAATFPGLPTALRLLPRPATTSLDIGALFSGARLSRSLSVLCRQELATGSIQVSLCGAVLNTFLTAGFISLKLCSVQCSLGSKENIWFTEGKFNLHRVGPCHPADEASPTE